MTTKIMNRGTCVMKVEDCPSKSAGVLYQKCQQNNMSELPSKLVLSTKRGTGTMKVSEYPRVEDKMSNWGFVTTCRGTATRRL